MDPVASGLTYADLCALPDDRLRHELIDGDHFVTPAPRLSHQTVVGNLFSALRAWAVSAGGRAFVAPTDVRFTEATVLEPDVLVVAADRLDALTDDRFITGAPSLVVEVSSPSTRSFDLIRKRRVYEAHGVPEFWFVDLDARRVERYVLDGAAYGPPTIVEGAEMLRSGTLGGLSMSVDEVFADV